MARRARVGERKEASHGGSLVLFRGAGLSAAARRPPQRRAPAARGTHAVRARAPAARGPRPPAPPDRAARSVPAAERAGIPPVARQQRRRPGALPRAGPSLPRLSGGRRPRFDPRDAHAAEAPAPVFLRAPAVGFAPESPAAWRPAAQALPLRAFRQGPRRSRAGGGTLRGHATLRDPHPDGAQQPELAALRVAALGAARFHGGARLVLVLSLRPRRRGDRPRTRAGPAARPHSDAEEPRRGSPRPRHAARAGPARRVPRALSLSGARGRPLAVASARRAETLGRVWVRTLPGLGGPPLARRRDRA